jgi:hypothetical protein
MRVFEAAKERIPNTEHSLAERGEFELSGDFVNPSVSHPKASSSLKKWKSRWVDRARSLQLVCSMLRRIAALASPAG